MHVCINVIIEMRNSLEKTTLSVRIKNLVEDS
jgi:hypothetical protein